MEVKRDRRNRILCLSQKAYVQKILREFGFTDSKPVFTPVDTSSLQPAQESFRYEEVERKWYARAIGSLMYLMLGIRPDVSCLSRFLANPTAAHIQAVKRVFRYLNGTADFELVFQGGLEPLKG